MGCLWKAPVGGGGEGPPAVPATCPLCCGGAGLCALGHSSSSGVGGRGLASRHARPGQHPLLSLTQKCPRAPRQGPPLPISPSQSQFCGVGRHSGWRPLSSQKQPCSHCFTPGPRGGQRGPGGTAAHGACRQGTGGGRRADAWSRAHPSGRFRAGGLSTPNTYPAHAPTALSKPECFSLVSERMQHVTNAPGGA